MGARLAPVLMVQGTASHAGKSTLVTAICRILAQDGYRVAPFKAQNMALNSFVAAEGGEIGRSQALQAEAAGLDPSIDMNPILLKPEADARSQVIIAGRPIGSLPAAEYQRRKLEWWPVVTASLDRLRARYDVVVAEGAGSPAEINLKQTDLANMRIAQYAEAPVLLVGDIDRGGVFASLLGTLELLTPDERRLVRGIAINKFRGDPAILAPGLDFLTARTGVPVLGVLPYLMDLDLPEEDSLGLERDGRGPDGTRDGRLDIAVVRLPRIANFDELAPLAAEPAVCLRYVERAADLGAPDLIILPGTKTTVADLAWLRERGLAERVVALARGGTPLVGICGGYQMLGRAIHDPEGSESEVGTVPGLGLLPLETTFDTTKRTVRVRGRLLADHGLLAGARDAEIVAYEIHMGRTRVDPGLAALTSIAEYPTGRSVPAGELPSPATRERPSPPAGEVPSPPASLRDATIGFHEARGPSASRDPRVADIISRARARGSPHGCAGVLSGPTLPGASGAVDGAVSADGLIVGTYLHGLFENDAPRHALIDALGDLRRARLSNPSEHPDRSAGLPLSLGREMMSASPTFASRSEAEGDGTPPADGEGRRPAGSRGYTAARARELDRLAASVREHLDLRPLLAACGLS